MIPVGIIQRLALGFAVKVLCILPDDLLRASLAKAATLRAEGLKPAEGLKFLFALDEVLYSLEGKLAITYDDGTHTKHRHIGYHEFFIARIRPGERVLDIGCGIGALAYNVAEEASSHVLAIDQNMHNIAQARRRHAHPRVNYCIGDVLRDLPDKTFDVVILSNVLEHLAERSAFLRRVHQVARPSRFLIRVPLFERDWRVPLKRELGVEWRLDSTHETEYTLESFNEEMAAAGLVLSYKEVRWGEIWAEAVPADLDT